MKVLVFAALFVAAIGSPRDDSGNVQSQGPWQVGKVYKYEVRSHTLARLHEGTSSGSAMKARFQLRVKSPGRLQAKLDSVEHAQVHQDLTNSKDLPNDLPFKPAKGLEQPFEITVQGGRVIGLKLPSALSLANENLLKGLVSSLQVDLSPHRSEHESHNFFDMESYQGQFNKKETDVTGDCETLYTILPIAPEWRRELPQFANDEEPLHITKSKNYGKCSHRVDYHFGVPDGAEWTGTAHNPRENQFMKRSTDSRIITGKQGPIYKTETTSTVYVSPLMYGQQKAEVLSYVSLTLENWEQDSEPEWTMPENARQTKNLLYSMTSKGVDVKDSSSSSSSSESSLHKTNEQEAINRVRRSSKLRKLIQSESEQIQKQGSSKSSSSSSSSSDSSSAYVNDDIPDINSPAYAALYLDPVSDKENKNSPMATQKMVQEIAQQLQNPNNLPKADALSKFNILVRIISTMTSEQLRQTSRSIEIAKTSNNILKSDMWMVFRDAVAQAGTIPAYHQIKSWMQSNKLQGEEAAQIMATLATTLRYPTKELMTDFFELAMSPEVRQQAYLNSTALISATRFINMGQVNDESAHRYYPSHMYGRLSRKHDRFVQNQILPSLSVELEKAIQRGDSHRAQVYIRAIGNLGHRDILDVFAPYLEGRTPVSTYMRRLMISSLDVLAHQKDHNARAVLYNVLRNTAEPYEVRVAAIHNIFMSRPTTPMVQAMAQMTHDDPSIQVRAALKTAILSVAELKIPRYWDLARTAQAAKELLTKEDFGSLYSSKFFNGYFDAKNELGLFSVMSLIGSEDSPLPKQMQFSWKTQQEGWNDEHKISASFSGVRQFIDYFQEVMNIQNKQKKPLRQQDLKYTVDKIAEMLNIKRDPETPLEANFNINFMNQQRFMVFSEDDMQQLPYTIQKLIAELTKGAEYHYTKLLNQAQVTVMFPVAMGVPFIFKYKAPTLVHVQAKSKAQMQLPSQNNKDYSASLQNEIQFTFARNLEGNVGFLDPLSNQFASAGVVDKIQLHFPVKLQVQVEAGKVRIHFVNLRPDQDTTIAHYSVWPYSAIQNRDSLVTISQDPTTKVLSRANKVSSIDTKFGLSVIATQFHLQGYSYSSDFRNVMDNIFKHINSMAGLAFTTLEKDIALTHYNFKYLGKQSQSKGVTLTAVYDKNYDLKENAVTDALEPSNINDMSPDSASRRQEMLNRVSSGIKAPKVQIVDLSATFEGQYKFDYILTAAVGASPVDPKIQYAFFVARNNVKLGNNQINGVGTVIKPTISTLNFLDALKQDLKIEFNSEIKFGQNGKIHIGGQMERTKKYTEILRNLPQAKQSVDEIAQNNLYQPASHEMIVMASAPDSFKASITYKDLSPAFKNFTHQVYRLARHVGFWYTEENLLRNSPDGKMDIEAEWSFMERTLNASVSSRAGDLRVYNAPILEVAPIALSMYTPFRMNERILNFYSSHQYLPFCTVDGNKINTFSNRAYDYTLSRSWHVVVQDDATRTGKHGHNQEQLVVLARRPNEKQQEVYISYRSSSGKDVEIDMKPSEDSSPKGIVNVVTDLTKISQSGLTMYMDENKQTPLVKYYALPDGVVMMNIEEDRVRMMYDGERLVILANKNRNNTRGICGYMSGDIRDDYLTPSGIVDDPALYAAAYAVNSEESDPKTLQLQQQASQMSYQPKQQYTKILRSDEEWQKRNRQQSSSSSSEEQSSHNVYRVRNYGSQEGPCMLEEQVQYYENHGEICITTMPLSSCTAKCRGQEYRTRAAQVVCRPKLDQQFRMYRDQIRLGQSPVVDGVTQIKQFKVPQQCKA